MAKGFPQTSMNEGSAVSALVSPRRRQIGSLEVRRVLPNVKHLTVGPFVFFDHMGPVQFPPGKGIDLPPHPHIGLATLTYLFQGAIIHRDSLGVEQLIEPGAVNWMVSGRGIVHSERTADARRDIDTQIEGIQVWIGLPSAAEEDEPSFTHWRADELPLLERNGVRYRLVAGEAFGEKAPVKVFSPMFYLHAEVPEGTTVELPNGDERAIYLVEGALTVDGSPCEPGQMAILHEGATPAMVAGADSRVMLLGGAPLEGRRYLWWNFVSSDPQKIEEAKRKWKSGGFDRVPGDDECVPLPED